jgi:hypothetical protein
MSVDLSKAKAGDKVVFRAECDGVCANSPSIANIVRNADLFKVSLLYPLSGIISTYSYSRDGELRNHVDESGDSDIVALVPELASPQREQEYVSPTGAKRNSVGKAPLGFFPLDLCEGAAEVMRYGAGKYSPGNYRKGFPPVEALHSLMRHVAAVQAAIEASDKDGSAGLFLDPESEQAHIHHVVTSALILVQSMKKEGWKV